MQEAQPDKWGMQGRGHVARVLTNETCNHGCAFCHRRRPQERRAFIAPDAVLTRIRKTAPASVVVLTGGEPTLRRDLARLVAGCREVREPPERIELETNGALLDRARAGELKAAGLDLVRIHLPAWGDEADALSRDAGGFEATLAGLAAALQVGLRVELSAPVLSVNRATLPALPAKVTQHVAALTDGPGVEALVLNVPVTSPDPAMLCSSAEAAETIQRVDTAARRVGLALRLDTATPLAPCFFPHAARVARLFALTPGGRHRDGYAQKSECESCMVRDRCPGVPRREAEVPLTPIREDRVRRRLSIISSVDDQVRRELFQDEVFRPPNAPARRTRTVRVAFNCNQACDFCFVSTHLPSADDEAIERVIREAAARGDNINLSGGEPTLRPELESWIAMAREAGAGTIEIQTNATRIDEDRARSLKAAGADVLFVSLHGSHAAVSDVVTQAPGTFDKTLTGLDAAHRIGLALRVNFVFCQTNRTDFPAFVRLVADRLPGAEVCVSFVAPSTDMVPRTRALIPRYTDIQAPLREGLRISQERGLTVSGFDAMCGLPLCLTPEEAIDPAALADAPEDYDGGEMVRGEACARCDAATKCFGLRHGYAEIYGTDELRPLRLPPSSPPQR